MMVGKTQQVYVNPHSGVEAAQKRLTRVGNARENTKGSCGLVEKALVSPTASISFAGSLFVIPGLPSPPSCAAAP